MKDKRQHEIVALLKQEQTLKTSELVTRFQVSLETIRRDINELERLGIVKKVYGGIRLITHETPLVTLDKWTKRIENCHREKELIAAKTIDYIPDHSIIAIDIGTTAYELAHLLSQKEDLSIITSSLLIASELAKDTNHKVYCIGGMVDPNEIVTTGIFANNFLNSFASIDIFISGADSITPTSGITEFHESINTVKQLLISKSKKVIVMADHSKFGKDSLFVSCPISDISVLITDHAVQKDILEQIQAQGVEVVIAE
jgi:DeoR/GlpR family transcriptional regulator of sugar metabolism